MNLATPNECEQSLTNPSGPMPEQSFVHQAIPLRCEEPQQKPAALTPINTRESVTFPNVKGLHQLQIQVPEIALTTTDPSPLIMGMLILHLGYKSQPPPWLGLIQQGNSQVSPCICWQSQPVSGPVGPSDSDTGLSHTPYLSLRTHSGDHAIQPSLLIRESDPAAGGDSYLAGEAGVPAQTKGFYSSIFIVQKKDGGQRPVINLKRLNYHVKSEHFKLETLHTVKSLL